jgi:hypothetical protein
MRYNFAWDEPANLLPDVKWISDSTGYGSNVFAEEYPNIRTKTLRKGTGTQC